jgi:hypothetical protein
MIKNIVEFQTVNGFEVVMRIADIQYMLLSTEGEVFGEAGGKGIGRVFVVNTGSYPLDEENYNRAKEAFVAWGNPEAVALSLTVKGAQVDKMAENSKMKKTDKE